MRSSTRLLLAVEIDINHVDMRKMQGLVFQTGMYPDDETLWDHVSPETRQRLEAFCEKYGVSSGRHVENEALGGGHDGIDDSADEERYGN